MMRGMDDGDFQHGYAGACSSAARVVTADQLDHRALFGTPELVHVRAPERESDRARVERLGFPEGVDYEALILGEDEDPRV